jgi:hypothetical protein
MPVGSAYFGLIENENLYATKEIAIYAYYSWARAIFNS